jgi:bifunctional non-homologous end joining protein LigD
MKPENPQTRNTAVLKLGGMKPNCGRHRDGFRIRVERSGDRVRLITRGGYDWTKRYPWIAEAALKKRTRQFAIDGETVILGVDGICYFNALH